MFEAGVIVGYEQVENDPFLLEREVGVLDQLDPAPLHLEQALTQNLEAALAAKE
jgi:hypothetical protein